MVCIFLGLHDTNHDKTIKTITEKKSFHRNQKRWDIDHINSNNFTRSYEESHFVSKPFHFLIVEPKKRLFYKNMMYIRVRVFQPGMNLKLHIYEK